MSKSVPLTFIVGFAVLVHESSSLPYTEILTNDAYPKINNETTIIGESNHEYNAYLANSNCLQIENTFCENLALYPENKIKKLLTPDFDKYFQQYPIKPTNRNQNAGDQSDNELCATSTGYLKPEFATTANNVSWFIVNIGLKQSQEIPTKTCMKDEKCSNVKSKKNYECYCKQKFRYQRLLAVDAKFEKLTLQLFTVPYGCCGVVRPIL